MREPRLLARDVLVHPYYDLAINDLVSKWQLATYVDILIVVDQGISTDPANDFGLASVIALIRGTRIGCMRFRVDIALRSAGGQSVNPAPTATQPRYSGFRFDMAVDGAPVLDKYEQVWCFGLKPGNPGGLNDASIDQPGQLPTSNDELNALDDWMTKRKGGLFGTGDHQLLGASMCRRMPRLGTMRRWTAADGAPPIGGKNQPNTADRIDTLRPPSPAYEPGAPNQQELDNGPHQGDLVVQPIRWVADESHWASLFHRHKRPHPVLCHPTLGPIDVMPDHAHEGLCVPNPNLSANKKWKAEAEYPDAIDGGPKPQPKIIAYGSNLGQLPYLFGKGVQPARSSNPMIAVYDGHKAGVGRVATDSTWHHWFDVNIDTIQAADTTDWKKIKRYFQNLAVWLNPPGYSTRCLYHAVVASHFQVVGFQEYHRSATVLELGSALRHHLHAHYGPCWVTEQLEFVFAELQLVDIGSLPKLRERFPDIFLDGTQLESLVLGQMVAATLDAAEKIKEGADERGNVAVEPLPEPQRLFAGPVREAFADFAQRTKQMCAGEADLLGAAFR